MEEVACGATAFFNISAGAAAGVIKADTPHPLSRRLCILPPWLEYAPSPDEVVIRLEPGMAFGTGLHPTTRLCLRALEDHCVPGGDLLDVGTGSGGLGIA